MSSEQSSPLDRRIPSPPSTPKEPDAATQKNPDYSTDAKAEGRVFHFKALGIKYGSDDKQHVASLVLSLLVLFIILLCLLVGIFVSDRDWIVEIAKIMGSAFLFIAGVAIGSSKKSK